jgi:UDP-glucose-4-epimerase GalE
LRGRNPPLLVFSAVLQASIRRHEAAMNNGPAILVTGGAGYIGSHCCRALVAAGCHPVVFDNFSTGHRSFVDGSLVTGDLLDKTALARAFAQHDVAAVMHFAASSLVGESVVDPQKYYANNVAGTLSLLEAMREARCNRLVFSSTGAVYGNADSKALPESHACVPINPYGASKWMIERILADYRSAYGLGAFCLRYFNASGADASGRIGELRDHETHLIPRAMMALQGHIEDFAVFGDDYGTPDGTAIRDYIHVTDLAAAHVLALRLLMQGHCGAALNLGTGSGFSVRQILRAIAAETGREVPHAVKPRRSGDPTYLVADPSAARETLKFQPAHSDLATIIRTAWAWHRKAHPLKMSKPLSPAA